MSHLEPEVSNEPPVGHVRVVYLGPVAPHWELQSDWGDRAMVDGFRDRFESGVPRLPLVGCNGDDLSAGLVVREQPIEREHGR